MAINANKDGRFAEELEVSGPFEVGATYKIERTVGPTNFGSNLKAVRVGSPEETLHRGPTGTLNYVREGGPKAAYNSGDVEVSEDGKSAVITGADGQKVTVPLPTAREEELGTLVRSYERVYNEDGTYNIVVGPLTFEVPSKQDFYLDALLRRAENKLESLARTTSTIREEAALVEKLAHDAVLDKLEVSTLLDKLYEDIDEDTPWSYNERLANLNEKLAETSGQLKEVGPWIIKAYSDLNTTFEDQEKTTDTN